MSAKNKGGSAREILGRGSRQVQAEAGEKTPARRPATAAEGARTLAGSSRREGTKRITVDLPRDEHKFLRDFAYDADSDGMRVVRALLGELRDDEELGKRVRGRLAAGE